MKKLVEFYIECCNNKVDEFFETECKRFYDKELTNFDLGDFYDFLNE